MLIEAISHAVQDCYPINNDELIIQIKTGKDIDEVSVVHGDPYSAGISGRHKWVGKTEKMTRSMVLKYHIIWRIKLKPPFKRERYYFEIVAGDEKVYLLEDGFYEEKEKNKIDGMAQYFKFPWLNPSDVNVVPDWVKDTIWYQIMPDRFCKSVEGKDGVTKQWGDSKNLSYEDIYGGDLKGIISKLGYLSDLGITGIYMTPIFKANSSHKYNTTDYTQIDPSFGDEEDMRNLVQKAHQLGIKVMIDAVFNHSGSDFMPWQDVLRNGKHSKYYDWFWINDWPIEKPDIKTKDRRYYSFAFEANMPKLNTNHPEVVNYFTELCKYWVSKWKIDGIRFDVGNEIAHSFIKTLRYELKKLNPQLFLLGEIWHNAAPWLRGDEYDSVMNYPLLKTIDQYFTDEKQEAKELMYGINRCYSLYQLPTNEVIFNFLDSHDVGRVYSRCKNEDYFWMQVALLMSLQGTACLYYGTEIMMEGAYDPFNRQCMSWKAIESGKYDDSRQQMKQLITLRKKYPAMKSGIIKWETYKDHSRLIGYNKLNEEGTNQIAFYLNAGKEAVWIPEGNGCVYQRKYEKGYLLPGGILIIDKVG